MKLSGLRKMLVALGGIAALLALGLREIATDACVWGIVGIVASFMGGNGLEWFGKRGGSGA